MDHKWSTISVFASSFLISLTFLGTVLGILGALEIFPFKDNKILGIILVIQLCLIIAFLITYIKIKPGLLKNNPGYIETFKKSGLVNAFRIKVQNPQRIDRVLQLVENEYKRSGHRQFRLVASSGYSYLDKMGNVWSQGLHTAVANGVEFKVVLESPFSSHAYARALACKIDYHHWIDKVNLDYLEPIIQKYRNLEIRVTSHPVNCSLFFTSESVFYDPYLWALPSRIGERVENNFWVFDFIKSSDTERLADLYECYSVLERHFEFLYEHSVSLEEFVGPNRENYSRLSNEFPERLKQLKRKGY
ncbi:MAG: hypothetical protein GWP06_18595 [Actinobacteria bacterium]|nr:hypothetical protein [Actinomycetota bacterium]